MRRPALTTFLNIISSVMPGARSLRAPFFAGILWTLFLWLLVAEAVPSRTDRNPLSTQAYSVLDFLGSTGAILLISILVFVVGATGTFAVGAVSTAIGRLVQSAKDGLKWQRHARAKRRQIRGWIREWNRTLQLASLLPKEPPADEGPADSYLRRIATQAEKSKARHEEELQKLEPRTGWKWFYRHCWIRNDALTQSALGVMPSDDEDEVADVIVQEAYNRAAMNYAEKIGFKGWPEHAWAGGASQDFLAEFRPDPVEALKALDDDLFVEVDRERSERELRVSISGPLIAMGIYGMTQASEWFWILIVLASALLVANSTSPARERSRIMKQVSLKGLETPAMRSAALQAQRDVIEAQIKADIKPAINPIPPPPRQRAPRDDAPNGE